MRREVELGRVDGEVPDKHKAVKVSFKVLACERLDVLLALYDSAIGREDLIGKVRRKRRGGRRKARARKAIAAHQILCRHAVRVAEQTGKERKDTGRAAHCALQRSVTHKDGERRSGRDLGGRCTASARVVVDSGVIKGGVSAPWAGALRAAAADRAAAAVSVCVLSVGE